MQIDFLNHLFYHVKGIINTRVEMYRSIEKPTSDFPPVGWKRHVSGEVWLCLSRNSDWDPDPADFEELRLQLSGQQQAAGTSSCRTELLPRPASAGPEQIYGLPAWRLSGLQVVSQYSRLLSRKPAYGPRERGVFAHLVCFFYGFMHNLTSPKLIEVSWGP